MSTFDELTKPLTTAEAKQAIYDAIAALGINTTLWQPGAPTRTMIAGTSIVLSALSQLQAAMGRGGFLALATEDWLTLLAKYLYDVDRDPGSFATGEVTLDNASGFVYVLDIGDLVVTNSTRGTSYRNTEAVTVGALATDVIVAVQAIELGSGSNAGAGEIDTLTTTLAGVTVTNESALRGTDEELDAALRIRCLEKTGTLSPNGPKDAYSYVARSTKRADGSSIGVTRVRTIPDGDGNVKVYVATASGGVTGTVGDLDTDLGVIDEAIQTHAVPHAVIADVDSAVALTINVVYELWISDSVTLSDEQIEEAIEERLNAFFASQPIGGRVISPASGKVYVEAIEAIIGGTFAVDELVKLAVTTPAADVDVDQDEAPVGDTIGVTAIHRVAGSVL
jgi:phage-related baseplate assembly protein